MRTYSHFSFFSGQLWVNLWAEVRSFKRLAFNVRKAHFHELYNGIGISILTAKQPLLSSPLYRKAKLTPRNGEFTLSYGKVYEEIHHQPFNFDITTAIFNVCNCIDGKTTIVWKHANRIIIENWFYLNLLIFLSGRPNTMYVHL